MSTDPFNIVKEELKKSINKTKSLVESYNVVVSSSSSALATNSRLESGDDTRGKLLADIRTNLRSITWDIQDLEETINIAAQNLTKFNLTHADIENRRHFISQTKDFVQKTKLTCSIELEESKTTTTASSATSKASNSGNINIRIPDIISNTKMQLSNAGGGSGGEYARLNDRDESDFEIDTRKSKFNGNPNYNSSNSTNNNNRTSQLQMHHEDILKEQDRNLDLISGRVSSLKNISQTMQNELDDQAVLLDDLGREMDTADSRMQTVMKKITKVLHMSNDRRQWSLIGFLLVAIFVVIILFAVLP